MRKNKNARGGYGGGGGNIPRYGEYRGYAVEPPTKAGTAPAQATSRAKEQLPDRPAQRRRAISGWYCAVGATKQSVLLASAQDGLGELLGPQFTPASRTSVIILSQRELAAATGGDQTSTLPRVINRNIQQYSEQLASGSHAAILGRLYAIQHPFDVDDTDPWLAATLLDPFGNNNAPLMRARDVARLTAKNAARNNQGLDRPKSTSKELNISRPYVVLGRLASDDPPNLDQLHRNLQSLLPESLLDGIGRVLTYREGQQERPVA